MCCWQMMSCFSNFIPASSLSVLPLTIKSLQNSSSLQPRFRFCSIFNNNNNNNNISFLSLLLRMHTDIELFLFLFCDVRFVCFYFIDICILVNNEIFVCNTTKIIAGMLSLALVLGPWLSLRTKLQSLVLALALKVSPLSWPWTSSPWLSHSVTTG